MQAIHVQKLVNRTQDLEVTEVPVPSPQPDEYFIEIKACAANFFDLLQIRGKYQWQPPLPWVGGSEFSGVILSTPSDKKSKRFKVGDRVFGSSQGAFAEKICVKEMDLQPIPNGWGFNEAAALYLTGPTAHVAIDLRARTQPGDWALIHGAAGGVGLSAIQFAKARGAKVIATATGARNISVCRSFGADHVIDYAATPAWERDIMKITSGHGVDVVFDPVGTISQSMKCAAFDARIVTIGFVGGQIESIKVNRILLKNIAVVGLHWGAYREFAPEMIPKVWEGLFKLIYEGKYKSTTFEADGVKPFKGLRDVSRALKLLEDKESWGKVVVDLSGEDKAKL